MGLWKYIKYAGIALLLTTVVSQEAFCQPRGHGRGPIRNAIDVLFGRFGRGSTPATYFSSGLVFPQLLDSITIDSVYQTNSEGWLNLGVEGMVFRTHKLNDDVPVASALSITGNPYIDSVLTINYTYSDTEGDLEGTSTFRWWSQYGWTDSTRQSYVLSSADSAYHVKAEVTPVAATGASPGAAVVSDSVGPVKEYGTDITPPYYVSNTGGGDTLQTIAEVNALSLVPGDTVLFKGGDSWGLAAEWNITGIAGTAAEPIVFGKYNESGIARPRFYEDGAGLYMITVQDDSYLTIQDWEIDGLAGSATNGILVGDLGSEGNGVDNLTLHNLYIHGMGSESANGVGIFLTPDDYDVSNVIIQNDTIIGVGSHAIAVYKATANVGSGTNNYTQIKNNFIRHWGMYDAVSGNAVIVRNENDSTFITDNDFADTSSADASTISVEQAASGGGRYATNLKVNYNTFDVDSIPFIFFDQGDAVTADIIGNAGTVTDGDFFVMTGGDDWTGATLNFYNNTAVIDGTAKGANLNAYSDLTLNWKNNSIYSNAGDQAFSSGTITNLTHNNNAYYKSDAGAWVTYNGTDYTDSDLATWEATAQVTDPSFNTEFSDLRPKEGSPLLTNGVDLTATVPLDILDSTYFTPMTIGAYADSVIVADPADSLYAMLQQYYSFEDVSGNAIDSTGNFDATVSGTPIYGQTGIVDNCDTIGGSAYFTNTGGTAGEYAEISISVWVKNNAGGGNVVTCRGGNDGYGLYLLGGAPNFRVYNSGVGNAFSEGTTDVGDNSWHHIIVVFNQPTIKVFVDGNTTPEDSDTFDNAITYASSVFQIGATEGDFRYTGWIDELAIWNYDISITSTNITWLYNSGSGRGFTDIKNK